MRTLRLLLVTLLGLILICIALANRTSVTVSLVPRTVAEFAGGRWSASMPLFLLIFLENIFPPIPSEVILPLAEMTLAEVARLKPGDVIESAPAAGGDAVLRAKGRDLFTTQIGRVGHANAVRIQGPIAPIAAALRAHAHQHTIKGGQ